VKAGRASVAYLDDARAVFETNVFGSSPSRKRCSRSFAKHPQRVSSAARLSDVELGPEEPAPLDVRHLLLVEDGAQRGHGRLRLRPRVGWHQS
jgi:hypothetical protein